MYDHQSMLFHLVINYLGFALIPTLVLFNRIWLVSHLKAFYFISSFLSLIGLVAIIIDLLYFKAWIMALPGLATFHLFHWFFIFRYDREWEDTWMNKDHIISEDQFFNLLYMFLTFLVPMLYFAKSLFL